MKLLIVLAWIAACVASPVSAQAVYRCGNTYSQVPCATDAKGVRITSAAAPDQPRIASGAGLCADDAPILLRFPDPPSTRVISVKKMPAEVIQYAGQPIAARQYMLRMNTKNRDGAYDGERPYLCFLSEDERRILKVETLLTPEEERMVAATEARRNVAGAAQRYLEAKQRCPSQKEIRNIEVELSKIENRDKQFTQAELRRQLAEANACR